MLTLALCALAILPFPQGQEPLEEVRFDVAMPSGLGPATGQRGLAVLGNDAVNALATLAGAAASAGLFLALG